MRDLLNVAVDFAGETHQFAFRLRKVALPIAHAHESVPGAGGVRLTQEMTDLSVKYFGK